MRRLLLCFSGAFLLGGAAVLGMYWWELRQAAGAQQYAKEWLNRVASRPISPETPLSAPHQPLIRRGDVLGELKIPRLHLSVMVFEGDDAGILKIGAGHIPGTSLSPGKGNIGIAAHRDTFFRPLREIHTNDRIDLRTSVSNAQFAVTKTEIVRPSDLRVLDHAPDRDLTLVTCYPFSYIGRAPRRFIVYAQRLRD